MANNVTNTLTAVITSQEDSTGSVPINRGTGNPALESIMGEFATFRQLPAGSNAIALPVSPCYQLYVKNLDNSNSLYVSYVPNAGTPQQSPFLNPGDQFIFWCDPANLGGITSLTFVTTGGSTAVEYFIGG